MNGGEGCENSAVQGELRRCIAHEMRHGAPKLRARRDRHPRDGGKRVSRGLHCDLPTERARNPSVGDAERVSAREPTLWTFLAGPALQKQTLCRVYLVADGLDSVWKIGLFRVVNWTWSSRLDAGRILALQTTHPGLNPL
jgi:hypothetical protein